MSQSNLEYDLDKLEERGINRYKAVLMASEEARLLNEQVRMGILEPGEKATTMALKRLYDGRIVEVNEEDENE